MGMEDESDRGRVTRKERDGIMGIVLSRDSALHSKCG